MNVRQLLCEALNKKYAWETVEDFLGELTPKVEPQLISKFKIESLSFQAKSFDRKTNLLLCKATIMCPATRYDAKYVETVYSALVDLVRKVASPSGSPEVEPLGGTDMVANERTYPKVLVEVYIKVHPDDFPSYAFNRL